MKTEFDSLRTTVYYRLEHLRLLGFLSRTQIGDRGGEPLWGWSLSDSYRRESGCSTVHRGRLHVAPARIVVERRGGLIVGAFLDAFADGALHASFEVRRIEAPAVTASRDEALVVWNGRHLRAGVSAIYCEHGWLPRWSFQDVSLTIRTASRVERALC